MSHCHCVCISAPKKGATLLFSSPRSKARTAIITYMYDPFLLTRAHRLRSSPDGLSIDKPSISTRWHMLWSVKQPACRLECCGQGPKGGIANLLERHQGGKRYWPIRVIVGLETLQHRKEAADGWRIPYTSQFSGDDVSLINKQEKEEVGRRYAERLPLFVIHNQSTRARITVRKWY